MSFGDGNKIFQGDHGICEALRFVFPEIKDDTESCGDESVGDDGGAATIDGVHAVKTTDDSGDVCDFGFATRKTFFFLQSADGAHSEKIGNEINDNGQIDQYVELFQKSRADGAKGQDTLNENAGKNGEIR